jgi:hypothetical protein
MTLSGAAQPPLTGEWAGDRARLTLSATGGKIDYDCGSGTIRGPLRLDARNRFKAGGLFEEYAPGPASADAPPHMRPTVYRGTLDGDTLTLVVQIAGSPSPRTLHLVRGKRIKLIRCL